MNWLEELFIGTSVAHSLFLISLVIAIGIVLGRFKVKGVSLGITWVLFVGILASHFGMRVDSTTSHFVKEFGLILFIYSIGLQVGPGFFASLKKGGIRLNVLAIIIVLLAALTAFVIHLVTGTDLVTMVGIMSGAVTNTPGLGAAQQTYIDTQAALGVDSATAAAMADNIATGYAVAYPLGVIGVIGSILLIKGVFHIKVKDEKEKMDEASVNLDTAHRLAVEIKNPAIFGKTLSEIDGYIGKKYVVSRLYKAATGEAVMPASDSVVDEGDKALVITAKSSSDAVAAFFGSRIDMPFTEWEKIDSSHVYKHLIITRRELTGKTLGSLKVRSSYGISITRVNRADVDIVPSPTLELQLGDRLTVVGTEEAINKASELFGNSMDELREPNLMPIFFGIAVGVLVGSIPFVFPGIPQPVKLGLAGGPLIVAILFSRFGPHFKVPTYTTVSANKMVREIGIALFLASVGLSAGESFVDTIVNGGYMWVLYGFIITVVPLLIVGFIGRGVLKLNFYQIMGLMAGSYTNPPGLAFTNEAYGSAYPSTAYATVYPISMFMRVLVAQLLVLLALA